jgi:hypothetical protein
LFESEKTTITNKIKKKMKQYKLYNIEEEEEENNLYALVFVNL